MLGVRLSPEIDQRLSRLSQKTHRTKSFYVKEALELYLATREEELLCIAEYEEQRKNGQLVTHTLEEIEKKYDLA